jgi:predicted unusual protein kinase regulating ubiquinone biosynthesis (AarF/ABC1/UbiB family)
MSATLSELLKALPGETEETSLPIPPLPASPLADLVTLQTVPTGQLRRLTLLGTLQAKIAAAYTFRWIRSWFQGTAAREKDSAETHFRVAVKVLDSMGYMRGAVMKVGQMLANFPDIIPKELVETLDQLHFQAPPMHFSLLREMVVDELGDEPHNLFAEFDEVAFAAASLGQVHRARLKSGEEVAVKIQYPGIARTIRSDFRNLTPALLPHRLSRDWENLKSQVEFLRRSIEQETDYVREAAILDRVRRLFHEEDQIVAPRVFHELSTKRILTMEYLPGVHLEDYLATGPSQDERNEFARKIQRAGCRVMYLGRMQNVDPHPGNYIFMPDGRLGLIDFGSVTEFSDPKMWEMLGRINFAITTGEEEAIRRVMIEWGEISDRPENADQIRLYVEFGKLCWEPYYTPGPYDFSDETKLRRGVDLIVEMARKRYVRQHESNLLQFRWQCGMWMLLYRLGAKIDGTPIMEEEVGVTGWGRPESQHGDRAGS